MSIPTSMSQLVATLIFVVPGFVYQGVRIRLVGRTPADLDLPTRLVRAIVASTVFGLIYVAALGSKITDILGGVDRVSHPRVDAILALFGAFAVPALVAWLISQTSASMPGRQLSRRLRAERFTRYDPRPSAWDVAFQGATRCFVRVRMPDGAWYAGWYGNDSWASSFPDERSLFLEAEYAVDREGVIGPEIENTAGAVLNCGDAVLVELLEGADPSR